MKALVIGSGGREHAIAWKLNRSDSLEEIYVWPGNAVTVNEFVGLPLEKNASPVELAGACRKLGIELVVIGPENYLEAAWADQLRAEGLKVFGPSKEAAKLESSKAFAKELMSTAAIPTAGYEVVENASELRNRALARLKAKGGVVVKASGLASGKGVFVCQSEEDIDNAVVRLYQSSLSTAAETVVLEDILVGRECSYFCTIGDAGVERLGFAVDFKRLSDGDQGPNTGGMGCYSPVPWLPEDAGDTVDEKVVYPLLKALEEKGINYQGFLYVGLMWSEQGPNVVEFNVRLGDPEAQVLAVQDKRDWYSLIARQLGLNTTSAEDYDGSTKAVAVILASAGYPYSTTEFGVELDTKIFKNLKNSKAVFAASVKDLDSKLATGSGRVMCVVASAEDFKTAHTHVYDEVAELTSSWAGVQFRKDIGSRLLNR